MHQFLFGTFPYIALTVLFLGSIVRYERDPFSWKSSSSQLLRRKQLIWGSVLFHVGILIIFVGHFVGLLTPISVFDAMGISHSFKQLLAAVAGGVAGIIALIGGIMLAQRRLSDPRIRATSSFADIAILLILLVQLSLGLISVPISLTHLDGHEMAKLMAWAYGIMVLDPNSASYITELNPIFKFHIVLGLTIFVIFPFTRLVHMLSAPIRYIWRPGYQIVRSRHQRTDQSK